MNDALSEIMYVVNTILGVVDKFERPIEILLIVILLKLDRNIKKNTAAISPPTAPAEPSEKEIKAAAKAEEKEKAKVRADLESSLTTSFKEALSVFTSGVPYEELTEEQKELCDKIAPFLGGQK